ncbi:uncharacterized protein LOC116344983 isoform X2 [Contarinia nasturtii]|nr:uncharacterized protein LOC116344983 isoform X2 [Contarinia nasturtii]
MFKLFVLSALLALAAAKPGYLHGAAPAFVSAPVVSTYAASPISYSARAYTAAAFPVSYAAASAISTYHAPTLAAPLPYTHTYSYRAAAPLSYNVAPLVYKSAAW